MAREARGECGKECGDLGGIPGLGHGIGEFVAVLRGSVSWTRGAGKGDIRPVHDSDIFCST